jgi:hypothetical protein
MNTNLATLRYIYIKKGFENKTLPQFHISTNVLIETSICIGPKNICIISHPYTRWRSLDANLTFPRFKYSHKRALLKKLKALLRCWFNLANGGMGSGRQSIVSIETPPWEKEKKQGDLGNTKTHKMFSSKY